MTSPAPATPESSTGAMGRWLVLIAALLGWMFDGLEMGLFPLVARPAMQDLLSSAGSANLSSAELETLIGRWITIITASFLIGAATGGALFGWLGDRIGRVRAMTLSVLAYAIFTGLCGLATSVEMMAAFRFIASLGMGGEWALGVALVMEVWKVKSRGILAGTIGAAANVGYLLVGAVDILLARISYLLAANLPTIGMPQAWVDSLLAHDGWRMLMLLGATPALLTLFIRFFVPESESWTKEQGEGRTSHWATRDLLGVIIGALGPGLMIYLWATESTQLGGTIIPHTWPLRLAGSVLGLVVATLGYLYPVFRYLSRANAASKPEHQLSIGFTIRRMLLGAGLSGVALLGTWGAIQQLPQYADKLVYQQALEAAEEEGDTSPENVSKLKNPTAKSYTQMALAIGAIIGTLVGALLGDLFGRRIAYVMLCLSSLVSTFLVYRVFNDYGTAFLVMSLIAGGCTAAFYGWLPLYLPELFRTRVRATGQGFGFNFGRIIAAVGVLQLNNLLAYFGNDLPMACTTLSLIYLVGLPIIFFAPETHGKPLPE